MIGIGLSGAHRTGKSTLAREYAEARGMELVLTSASEVLKDLGIDPKADISFDERIYAQTMILAAFVTQWSAAREKVGPEGIFISDRTPIDLMAYTLADVQRQTLNEEQDARLRNYLQICYAALNKFFQVIVVVPPAIKVIEETGKAPGSYGYVEHIHSLVLGLTVSDRNFGMHFLVPTRHVLITQRIAVLDAALSRVSERYKTIMKHAEGEPLH